MRVSPLEMIQSFPAAILPQDWKALLDRVWHFLDDPHHIGSLEISITRLVQGVLILALALLLSRTLTKLLQRRIAKQAYLDPGLRYTMGRLFQYLIISLGILFALKAAFNLDLTS